MLITFTYTSNDERNELERIVHVEAEKHFESHCCVNITENNIITSLKKLAVAVSEIDFFNDIQKSRSKMINNKLTYFPDFISDVEDNLSFFSYVGAE